MNNRTSNQIVHHPRGVTVVEVLVVIAIISLLFALLLPAIMAAREASYKMKCLTKMHNLHLAEEGYAGVMNAMPPGVSFPVSQPGANEQWIGNGWFYLWPYMDQVPLWEKSLSGHVRSPYNNDVYKTPIGHFICPSDVTHDS